MIFHAFVDESEPSTGDSPVVYLLAAAVIAVDHLDTARTTIETLRLRSQRKLHWRDENDNRRMLGIKTIATLPALHLVVVRAAADERSERRRRLCLRRLLCELDHAGVAQVILERRQRRQDQADCQLLSALRAAKAVSSGLRMEHAAGTGEPLLWLPDFVPGAAGAARRGTHNSYLDQLMGLVNVLEA